MVRLSFFFLSLVVLISPVLRADLLLSMEEVGYENIPLEVERPKEDVLVLLQTSVVPGKRFYARSVNEGREIILRGTIEAVPGDAYRIQFSYSNTEVGPDGGGVGTGSSVTVTVGKENVIGGFDSEQSGTKSSVKYVLTLVRDDGQIRRDVAVPEVLKAVSPALLRSAPNKQIDEGEPDVADVDRKIAAVNGKYAQLLRRINVPGDVSPYGAFYDYGHWTGSSYMGFSDLPSGYWVYLEPHWYIWKDSKATQND